MSLELGNGRADQKRAHRSEKRVPLTIKERRRNYVFYFSFAIFDLVIGGVILGCIINSRYTFWEIQQMFGEHLMQKKYTAVATTASSQNGVAPHQMVLPLGQQEASQPQQMQQNAMQPPTILQQFPFLGQQ
ncbi:hypothetical protein CAEBREN_10249 [Caenorhabditis brenneri]|uniref:Uncharacterized protein n=1 Tax=Caenorhabditis brenneri TaxID=135651 RepID=G0P7T8_CAEBE|nr:hypothetical protein CAEBREN_10249 [Caenorhabditis brenneri]